MISLHTMNSPRLEGILPVVPTPYNAEGKADVDAIIRVAQFCLDAGAGALVFPGVASEYNFIDRAEMLELLQAVCHVARDHCPVVCGGGKGSASEIAQNLREARKLGVVAAMVLIPREFADDVAGARQFILSVIMQAPGIDIVLQNAPAPVGAGLSAEDLISIVNASPAIRYVKEESLPSGPRISAIRDGAGDHLIGVIGGGGARYLIDEMTRGAIAAMPAAEITDIHVRMWNAFQEGNEAEARELYMRTLPLLVIQFIYRMRFTKRVLTMRGILNNDLVRAPLPAFDEYDERELTTLLDGIQDLMTLAPIERQTV